MSIPGREALLEAALKYLEHELLPTLQGEHRFKTRLAVNALRIVQRESDMLAGEAEDSLDPNGDSLLVDEVELSRRIREGEVATDDPALRAYLRKSLQRALSINNPKWFSR